MPKKPNPSSSNTKGIFYWLYAISIIGIAIIVAESQLLNIPISYFLRDPQAITNSSSFYGLLSNIGIIVWSLTVATTFFAFIVLRNTKNSVEVRWFLISGSMLSALLLFDDLLMLHERVYPHHLGVEENVVYLIYFLLFAGYVIIFRKLILNSEYIYFLLTSFFFSISLVFDVFLSDALPGWQCLIEDGAKFFGIISWFAFNFTVCFKEIKTRMNYQNM